MKLIIKQYLASLKERGELDAILPDLISQCGLNVFSTPGRGTRQDGVDVGAVGSLDGKTDKVYLFTIKAGDLTRSNWNGNTDQALLPSLDEILYSYIRTRLPVEHKDKKIVICICLGGDIREQVRTSVEGYIEKATANNQNIEFETWNGDRLAELIISNFLQEDLMPSDAKSMLRKSLALLDNPETSYKHFKNLIYFLLNKEFKKDSDRLIALRQVNICIWIIFSWGRDANNVESAYLSSELAVLCSWNVAKSFMIKDQKIANQIQAAFSSILNVYLQICSHYIDKMALQIPKLHAISSAIRSPNKVDVNLKLFDVLGRIAMQGIWAYYSLKIENNDPLNQESLIVQVELLSNMLKSLIANNPALLLPIKDEQTIDISIAITFLIQDAKNHDEIKSWLNQMFNRAVFSYINHIDYPCIINSYSDLLDHPKHLDNVYREEVTSGSILYPMMSLWASLLGDVDLYEKIKSFKKNKLEHCNFQLWYLDESSEKYFYLNSETHGALVSNVGVHLPPEKYISQIFLMCEESPYYKTMSVIELNLLPLILMGCRHYRLPLPIDLLKDYKSDVNVEC